MLSGHQDRLHGEPAGRAVQGLQPRVHDGPRGGQGEDCRGNVHQALLQAGHLCLRAGIRIQQVRREIMYSCTRGLHVSRNTVGPVSQQMSNNGGHWQTFLVGKVRRGRTIYNSSLEVYGRTLKDIGGLFLLEKYISLSNWLTHSKVQRVPS